MIRKFTIQLNTVYIYINIVIVKNIHMYFILYVYRYMSLYKDLYNERREKKNEEDMAEKISTVQCLSISISHFSMKICVIYFCVQWRKKIYWERACSTFLLYLQSIYVCMCIYICNICSCNSMGIDKEGYTVSWRAKTRFYPLSFSLHFISTTKECKTFLYFNIQVRNIVIVYFYLI